MTFEPCEETNCSLQVKYAPEQQCWGSLIPKVKQGDPMHAYVHKYVDVHLGTK